MNTEKFKAGDAIRVKHRDDAYYGMTASLINELADLGTLYIVRKDGNSYFITDGIDDDAIWKDLYFHESMLESAEIDDSSEEFDSSEIIDRLMSLIS